MSSLLSPRRWGLVAAFLIFCTFLAVATPSGTFLSGRNLVYVLLQISVNTILASGMTLVILSKGIWGRLQVCPETLDLLKAWGAAVEVLQTEDAVKRYNELHQSTPVGGLFHSTC